MEALGEKRPFKCCKTRDYDFEKNENPACSNVKVTRQFFRQKTPYFG